MQRLLLFTCFVCFSGHANAADFWLSTVGDPNIGSAPPVSSGAVPSIVHPVGTATGTIFVWARPDAGKTLSNWSLNLVSTNPNVLTFTGSVVEPFNVLDGLDPNTVRWEQVDEPTGSNSAVDDIQGFSLFGYGTSRTGIGIGPQSTGSPFDDPYYDSANDAWLVAQVDYSLSGTQEQTDLYLQIGSDGLNNFSSTPSDPNNFLEPSLLTSAVFGATTDAALNAATERLTNSATPDASIELGGAVDDANFNGDSFVDGLDFLIWQQNAGGPGSQATGDANGDGQVGSGDLAVWETQYGGPPPLVALHTVPEPAVLSLVIVACCVMSSNRHRS